MKELPRLRHPGAIDADGHVLEPPDLWERYLEPRFRDRALRLRKDERGLEYLEIDGRQSKLLRNNMPAGLGAMDRVGGIVYERAGDRDALAHSAGQLVRILVLEILEPNGLHKSFRPFAILARIEPQYLHGQEHVLHHRSPRK